MSVPGFRTYLIYFDVSKHFDILCVGVILFEPQRKKMYLGAYAPSRELDQTADLRSLIRIFVAPMSFFIFRLTR